MKIATKTQTNRATNWKEGYNCVNLHLIDKVGNSSFQMGLQVTNWGNTQGIEPLVVFLINGTEYRLTIPELSDLLT